MTEVKIQIGYQKSGRELAIQVLQGNQTRTIGFLNRQTGELVLGRAELESWFFDTILELANVQVSRIHI